ncbi:MAG: homogentisate 1,2-dioxygenase [Bdellovibrionaceae bacterium]|nr:homogentisate 1,2-dioxygenase [Pseudobdellovibrionaceae bacterium]
MHHYTQGISTRQAHKGIPEGRFEEEQGLDGFFGPVSHLIKEQPSTRWVEIEGPLKPRLYDIVKFAPETGIQRLLYNNDITISNLWMMPAKDPSRLTAQRNADGDWLYFCHKGGGRMLTEYGELAFSPGAYIVVPKCITHAFLLDESTNFLLVENRTSHFREPDRGLVGRHAVYDINTIGKPDLEKQYQTLRNGGVDPREVHIKHTDQITKIKYDSNIFDTIGWKGDLFPFTLHMNDLMPLMSHRAHLPPSAHTNFVARGFVVCSFVPRPLESDADALKVPFYHQNIDYDEVLFYHAGDFFSRDNLHAGMMSFHPAGFPHGPHPKAMQKITTKTHTDEYAVMIDTRWPLQRDPVLEKVELPEYYLSWRK